MALSSSSQPQQHRRWPRSMRGSNSSSKNCCSSTAWSQSDVYSLDGSILVTKEGVVVEDLHNHYGTRQSVAPATEEESSDEVSVTSSTDSVGDSLSFGNDKIAESFPALFVEVSNSDEPFDATSEGEENNAPSTSSSTITDKVKKFKSMTARLDALRIQQQLQGMNHPDVIFSKNRLGQSNGRRGDLLVGKSSKDAASRRREASLRGCGRSRRVGCQKLSHEWY